MVIEVVEQLRRGAVTSAELVEAAIAAADRWEPALGAYLVRFDDSARAAARRADEARARGDDLGPLHGVPIGVKDVFCTVEGPTTAQSRAWDSTWGAGTDADAVARLRAAGAIVTGKTTTMELAVGAPASDEHFPVPRNPWDLDRWAGGSSSGSAAGVAAGLFPGALGSDTGGSIRLPAAYCGVTGLKPTFGRVPTGGVVPLAPSMDTAGPIARSAADCALLLAVLDPGFSAAPRPDLAGLRVGVHEEVPGVEVLRSLGAEVREVELPLADAVGAAVMVTLACEGFAHHGARLADAGPVTRVRLTRGSLVTGADYVQAQRVRELARGRLAALFDEVDVVVHPTVAGEATTILDLASFGPGGRIRTGYWNGVGNPVASIPVGVGPAGLPLGMQVAAAPGADALVLAVAEAFQSVTDHHRRVPPGPTAPTSTIAPPPWLDDEAGLLASFREELAALTAVLAQAIQA